MQAGARADEDGVRLGIDDVDVGGVDAHRAVGHACFHRKTVGDDRRAFADRRRVIGFRVVDRDAYADAGAAGLRRRRAVAARRGVGVVVRLERERAAGFDLEAVADRRLRVRDRDRDADGARHLHRAVGGIGGTFAIRLRSGTGVGAGLAPAIVCGLGLVVGLVVVDYYLQV